MFRIAEFETRAARLPLAHSVAMSGERVSAAENLIVRVTDGEGNAGWGEAASAPLMTGETLPGMLAATQYCADRLIGKDIASIHEIPGRVDAVIHGNPGVKTALEMALLDLAGRRAGQPVYELLGGKVRERAPVVRLLSPAGGESEIDQVRRSLDEGIKAFKVKVGLGSVVEDLDRCRRVREAAGSEPRVSADANEGFRKADGVSFCRGAREAGLDFVEQPVRAADIAAMRFCANASTVPVGADEGFRNVEDIRRHHEAGAASGGSLKPLKLGIQNLMSAGFLMRQFGMKVNLAGKVAETSIGSAAIAHLAVALPQIEWDVSPTNQYLAFDIAAEPVTALRGSLAPADTPGLGIEVDAESLGSVCCI